MGHLKCRNGTFGTQELDFWNAGIRDLERSNGTFETQEFDILHAEMGPFTRRNGICDTQEWDFWNAEMGHSKCRNGMFALWHDSHRHGKDKYCVSLSTMSWWQHIEDTQEVICAVHTFVLPHNWGKEDLSQHLPTTPHVVPFHPQFLSLLSLNLPGLSLNLPEPLPASLTSYMNVGLPQRDHLMQCATRALPSHAMTRPLMHR